MNDEPDAILRLKVLDSEPEAHFDDVAALAAELCQVPTALVSIVDTNRQWFKARIGFDLSETDLDRSVCRHVVAEAQTVVIPDLTADDRTRANPLVTDEPHLRFYAGAPLTTRYGIVGTLCVIDVEPRPNGLDERQRVGLERLASIVSTILEMRRDALTLAGAEESHRTIERSRDATESRWRDLYRKMDQGFIYAHAVRDEAGRLVDWRYDEVNAAWGRLLGIDPEHVVGRTVREVIPGIEDKWIAQFAQVVDRHEPLHFTRRVGSLDRWYDGTAQSVGDDHFTVIFHEVTGRVQAVRRRDALLALGDMLRSGGDSSEMTSRAAEIVGKAIGAARATFGDMDHTRERLSVAPGWAVEGMPPIAGDYRFDDYGRVRQPLVAGEIVVIEDIDVDERTAAEAAGWHALKARAVVNVPVRDAGRTTAVLIVQDSVARHWDSDEIAFLRSAADRIEAALARRRDEERQEIVNGEIAHRLKNTLAIVQAIANQTLRSCADDGLEAFTERLQALGMAHDALNAGRWKEADLGSVLAGVLDGAGVRDRYDLSGPDVRLGARAALSLSLLSHELATNAIKHGSLSVDGGRVGIDWRIEGEDDLVLDWSERNGPPAIQPTRRGFGSRIVRMGLVGTGGSTIRYGEHGLEASFRAPLAQVESA